MPPGHPKVVQAPALVARLGPGAQPGVEKAKDADQQQQHAEHDERNALVAQAFAHARAPRIAYSECREICLSLAS